MRHINISSGVRSAGDKARSFNLHTFIWISCLLIAVHFSSSFAETRVIDKGELQGVWKGQFDINGRGPYDFLAVHHNGVSYAYSIAATTVCVGTANLSGKNYQANYRLFAMDGGQFDLASIEGVGSRSSGIQSRFLTQKAQDEGSLWMSYQNRSEPSLPVNDLQGDWGFVDRDEMSVNATFTTAGKFTAVDSQGCEYQGEIAAIESLANVYELQVVITLCASVDGEYWGMGFLDGDGQALDHFKMIISNERYGMFYDFRKGAASEYVPLYKDRLRL